MMRLSKIMKKYDLILMLEESMGLKNLKQGSSMVKLFIWKPSEST